MAFWQPAPLPQGRQLLSTVLVWEPKDWAPGPPVALAFCDVTAPNPQSLCPLLHNERAGLDDLFL